MNLDIYISSLAFQNQTVERIIEISQKKNWGLEFSSGITYQSDVEALYINAPIKRLPHNYFPAPKIPFVINLASSNEEIRQKSIQHCKKSLYLAKKSGSPFYAAHAGFCIDPKPDELGRNIRINRDYVREYHKKIFLSSLDEILSEAQTIGMDFLIENNVIAPFNYIEQKANPFLCCESKEIQWIFETLSNDRFGLLLDTAHLKVSCKTLGLNLDRECKQLFSFIKGIHHSDNSGEIDDNQPINENYWFFNHLLQFNEKVHIIEVKNINTSIIHQQINLLETHGCK